MLLLQVVSDVLTVTDELSMASEKLIRIAEFTETAVAPSAGLIEVIEGWVRSILNKLRLSDPMLLDESLTETMQSL